MFEETQTILLIDDHPLMRKGIVQLIAMTDSLRLIDEVGNGQQGLELAVIPRYSYRVTFTERIRTSLEHPRRLIFIKQIG